MWRLTLPTPHLGARSFSGLVAVSGGPSTAFGTQSALCLGVALLRGAPGPLPPQPPCLSFLLSIAHQGDPGPRPWPLIHTIYQGQPFSTGLSFTNSVELMQRLALLH